MKKYVIISDSSIDLPKETRERFEIEFPIPGKIIYSDGRIEDADSDWEHSTPKDYFEGELKKGIKTSLPNQYEITSRLEPFFEQGLDILAIVLSSGISGTYSAFITAGEELMAKYPERKIIVVVLLKALVFCIRSSRSIFVAAIKNITKAKIISVTKIVSKISVGVPVNYTRIFFCLPGAFFSLVQFAVFAYGYSPTKSTITKIRCG